MKMLFDHCVPKPLRHELKEHEVSTAKEMGWKGLRNGQLLEQAQANGFDVVITVDQNIRSQQNLKGRAIAVCVLVARGVTVEDLRPLVPSLERLLPTLKPGGLYEVRQ